MRNRQQIISRLVLFLWLTLSVLMLRRTQGFPVTRFIKTTNKPPSSSRTYFAPRTPVDMKEFQKKLFKSAEQSRKTIKGELPFLQTDISEWEARKRSGEKDFDPNNRLQVVDVPGEEPVFVVSLPSIKMKRINPKGYIIADDGRTFAGSKLILDGPRQSLVQEFLFSLSSPSPYGVLFSGPAGIGKSGVQLLSYLTCFVRDVLTVYLPDPVWWTEESKSKEDMQQYFLERFYKQNIDLIAKNAALQNYFAEQFNGEAPIAANYDLLLRALQSGGKDVPRCALLLDDTQALTRAIKSPDKVFFRDELFAWERDTSLVNTFRTQLCASVHGDYELSLVTSSSPTDAQRLRFLRPYSEQTTLALLHTPGSPFHVPHISAEEAHEVFSWCGGMPRTLERFGSSNLCSGEVREQMLARSQQMVDERRALLRAQLPLCAEREEDALRMILSLSLDQEPFSAAAKPLYDYGFCFVERERHNGEERLMYKTVNECVRQALSLEASEMLRERVTLSAWDTLSGEREQVLKYALLSFLRECDCIMSVLPLSTGSAEGTTVDITVTKSRFLPPTHALAVNLAVHDTESVLWIANDLSARDCVVDGVVVPSLHSPATSPVALLSALPLSKERLRALQAKQEEVRNDVRFQNRSVVVLLHGSDAHAEQAKELLQDESTPIDRFFTLGQKELEKRGIRF